MQTEASNSSPVSRMLGVSMEEVENMISTGNIVPVFDAALNTGDLAEYSVNAFAPQDTEQSLPNFNQVVEKLLTTDEIRAMAKGDTVDVSVSLTKTDADESTRKKMEETVGHKPLQYFDLTMLKTMDGHTERVSEIPVSLEVVIEVPDEIYSEGKTYSVLRLHQGTISVLPDLDDNPKTITFRTDRFSSYAIAQEIVKSGTLVNWIVAGAAIAFGIALSCFLILIIHQAKWKRARRHAGAHAHS